MPRLATSPQGAQTGQGYYDSVSNKLLYWNGAAWVNAPAFRVGHTWAVGGALTAGLNVPQIFVPMAAGQAATLVSARSMLGSGTSIVAQVQLNGSNLGGAITATTTATTTAFSQALADMDTLDLVLSAPAGSPTDLSFTIVVEHQL